MMVDLLCAARVENSTESASCTCKPVYAAIIPNIAVSSFLCYTTAMMNIVTIYALGKTSSILKPLKILLLSLAVSDLCTGLLSLPLNIAWQIQMLRCNLDKIPAVLNVFCSNFLYLSSLLGLTVLSADRFVAIQMPLRYKELVTHKRVVIIVIAKWLFCAIFTVIDLFFTPKDFSFAIHFTIESTCFFLSTCFSFKVYLTANLHRHRFLARSQQVAQSNERTLARLRKSALGTFWIYLVFWACYLPNFIVYCIFHLKNVHTEMQTLETCAATLVYVNSYLNPIIYCWKMRPIRRTMMNSLRGLIRK